MFSSQAFATATRLNPSINLLAESKNILVLPTSLRNEEYVPGLVFVGQRQEQLPVRLVIFAGSEEEDSVGSLAFVGMFTGVSLHCQANCRHLMLMVSSRFEPMIPSVAFKLRPLIERSQTR